MIDTGTVGRTYKKKMKALQRFTDLWWFTKIRREPTKVYWIGGGCIAYELVAGVFAKTDGSTFTVQRLPSLLTPARRIELSQKVIGFRIEDFALDPTQDLVVFMEARSQPHFIRDTILHVRTLSTHECHPEAKEQIIQFSRPPTSSATMQLADDLLSIFFPDTDSPRLLLWDWKTATMIYDSANEGYQLPAGSHAFEILSSRSYAILSTANGGCIYVYNIDYPQNILLPPVCVAKLLLPPLQLGIRLSSLVSHTGPFLSRPRCDGIFTTDPEARVYVISARFLRRGNTQTPVTFFLHGSAFAPYTRITGRRDAPLEVPWVEWSHQKCFVTPFHLPTNWLRYVQGTRVVMYMDPELAKVGIFDFNLGHVPIEEGKTSTFGLFRDEIHHILPPRRRTMFVKKGCASLMVDEDYILGLNTNEYYDERIESLEVFSMHHANEVPVKL
ncbi:hypothetical protein AN958_09396 [Leucoagaricus sp. SymC.cos]|nr:hypothetical protein AN958_09396 [Leucoagaricus sp. SymC.cos]